MDYQRKALVCWSVIIFLVQYLSLLEEIQTNHL